MKEREFVKVRLSSINLHLFAQRAVFAPACKTLFAADLHLGKDATFRTQGIAVPCGGSADCLAILQDLIEQTRAERLVILGDMFHARSSLAADTCRMVDGFFKQHANLEVILVRGNHDAHTWPLLQRWPIEIVEPGYQLGSLELGHEPAQPSGSAKIYLCGHLHPAIRASSRQDSIGRLPCFWYSQGCFVLPAIGRFTGTHLVQPDEGDQLWVAVEDAVLPFRATAST